MSFADTNTVGGVPPLPIGVKPVSLPISMADVTGLVTTMVAMPLPGNNIGQMLRWNGVSWAAFDPDPSENWVNVPPTDSSPGNKGEMAHNNSALYVCIEDDMWIKLTDTGAGSWL